MECNKGLDCWSAQEYVCNDLGAKMEDNTIVLGNVKNLGYILNINSKVLVLSFVQYRPPRIRKWGSAGKRHPLLFSGMVPF